MRHEGEGHAGAHYGTLAGDTREYDREHAGQIQRTQAAQIQTVREPSEQDFVPTLPKSHQQCPEMIYSFSFHIPCLFLFPSLFCPSINYILSIISIPQSIMPAANSIADKEKCCPDRPCFPTQAQWSLVIS